MKTLNSKTKISKKPNVFKINDVVTLVIDCEDILDFHYKYGLNFTYLYRLKSIEYTNNKRIINKLFPKNTLNFVIPVYINSNIQFDSIKALIEHGIKSKILFDIRKNFGNIEIKSKITVPNINIFLFKNIAFLCKIFKERETNKNNMIDVISSGLKNAFAISVEIVVKLEKSNGFVYEKQFNVVIIVEEVLYNILKISKEKSVDLTNEIFIKRNNIVNFISYLIFNLKYEQTVKEILNEIKSGDFSKVNNLKNLIEMFLDDLKIVNKENSYRILYPYFILNKIKLLNLNSNHVKSAIEVIMLYFYFKKIFKIIDEISLNLDNQNSDNILINKYNIEKRIMSNAEMKILDSNISTNNDIKYLSNVHFLSSLTYLLYKTKQYTIYNVLKKIDVVKINKKEYYIVYNHTNKKQITLKIKINEKEAKYFKYIINIIKKIESNISTISVPTGSIKSKNDYLKFFDLSISDLIVTKSLKSCLKVNKLFIEMIIFEIISDVISKNR